MVKIPRTRHSNTEREPVTIDLGPDEVSRVASEAESPPADAMPDEVPRQEESPKEDIGASVTAPTTESTADTPIHEEHPEAFPESEKPAPVSEGSSETANEPTNGPEPEKTSTGYSAYGRDAGTQNSEPPHAAAPPRRASRGSALAAGVAGGAVVLAVGAVLHYAGLIGAPGSTVPASLEAEIAGLKSEVEVLKAAAGAPADLSGLTSQIDGQIDGQIGSLSQGLEQVRADVASLRQTVEAGGAGEGEGLQALDAKVAEIESRIADIGPGTDGASSQDIAAINERIAAVEALSKAATDAGSAIESRLGALEQSVSALTSKVDAQAGQPKIALAIAASALKAAIERGAQFQPEVETFAAIAPEAPGLAELRAYAESGVATRADLVVETDAAAKAMIAAANPPPANAGFFERLLTSAESLVTVRPIGAVEGAGVPETVARMEVALQAGDLEKAIAEYDTLPEAAKAAGAAFADKVRARLAAEQLADQAITAAMQAA